MTAVGARVRLIRCQDEYTRLRPGDEGVVTLVDDAGTVHVKWDGGARLGLIADAGDRWEVLDAPAERTYKVVRFRESGGNTVVKRGLTLDEAQAHCSREDTHGEGWFDGYDLENPTAEDLAERADADRRLREGVDAMRRLGL